MITTATANAIRSITGSELTRITGSEKLSQAISIVAGALERRSWSIDTDAVSYGGVNWEKDFVLFTSLQSVGHGVVSYRAWRVSISNALDTVTGKLSAEIVNRRV